MGRKRIKSKHSCPFCGAPVSAKRVAIGLAHCMKDSCVATWRQRRIADNGLALVTMHKQGPAWVKREDVPKNDMRRQGGA